MAYLTYTGDPSSPPVSCHFVQSLHFLVVDINVHWSHILCCCFPQCCFSPFSSPPPSTTKPSSHRDLRYKNCDTHSRNGSEPSAAPGLQLRIAFSPAYLDSPVFTLPVLAKAISVATVVRRDDSNDMLIFSPASFYQHQQSIAAIVYLEPI